MNQPKTTHGSSAGSQPIAPAKVTTAPAGSAGTPGKSTVAPARASGAPKPAIPGGVSAKPSPAQPQPRTGKVVHDERGNAVWDWVKQTSRNAIESTTRMLRKLDAPELKVEQTHEEELRIQPDNGQCSGGGYDPYNQPTKQRRTPSK